MTPDPCPNEHSPFTCLFPREKEENWAASQSTLTRLLGWILSIHAVLFFALGLMIQGHADLGGLALFLVAGSSIRKGSQAWIRFIVVFNLLSLPILASIVWTFARGEPYLLNAKPDRWIDYSDQSFWLHVISPLMVMLAVAALGMITLHSRSLTFWTKTARVWGYILGGAFILMLAFGIYQSVKDSRLRASTEAVAKTELQAIHNYLHTHGSSHRSGPMTPLERALAANPRILKVSWNFTLRSSFTIYTKPDPQGPAPAGSFSEFQEFVRLPSGEWIRINLHLLLPD